MGLPKKKELSRKTWGSSYAGVTQMVPTNTLRACDGPTGRRQYGIYNSMWCMLGYVCSLKNSFAFIKTVARLSSTQ